MNTKTQCGCRRPEGKPHIKIARVDGAFVTCYTSDGGVDRTHIGDTKFNPVVPITFNLAAHPVAVQVGA